MPSLSWLHDLAQLLLHFFQTHQLPTLFALLVVEEAGVPIPIPGDTLIMLAGAQSHAKTVSESVAVLLVSTLAVFLGSSLLYAVMRRGGRPLLARYGKLFHLSPQRLERMERWFRRRGRVALVVGRLVPGLRIPTTAMAGLTAVPYPEYAITAAIAAALWSGGYFWLGLLLGREGPWLLAVAADLLDDLPKWLLVLGAFAVSAGAGTGIWHLRRRRARPLP